MPRAPLRPTLTNTIPPPLLFSLSSSPSFLSYAAKRNVREAQAFRFFQDVITNRRPLINVKEHAPYTDEDESRVYLDPSSRASYDPRHGSWSFSPSSADGIKSSLTASKKSSAGMGRLQAATSDGLASTMRQAAASMRSTTERGLGVDVEDVSTFAAHVAESATTPGGTPFLQRNFTPQEIAYCMQAANPSASYVLCFLCYHPSFPLRFLTSFALSLSLSLCVCFSPPLSSRHSFAGRWAAKEATIKAISSSSPDSKPVWKGAAAPLIDIEVVPSSSGAPVVNLSGHAKDVAAMLGLSSFTVSISHTSTVAIAQASAE